MLLLLERNTKARNSTVLALQALHDEVKKKRGRGKKTRTNENKMKTQQEKKRLKSEKKR